MDTRTSLSILLISRARAHPCETSTTKTFSNN
jgi:hypothetical protein